MTMPKNRATDGRIGPKPHRWISGRDELTHEQYASYLMHKAQAKYRKEEYNFKFLEYKKVWDTLIPFQSISHWTKKGRKKGQYKMNRIDKKLPWDIDNVKIELADKKK